MPLAMSHDVLFRTFQDEAVLLHLGTEAYYSLNESALRMWDLLVDGHEPAAVAQMLQEEYDVEHARVLADVETFVRAALDAGLLVTEGAQPAGHSG